MTSNQRNEHATAEVPTRGQQCRSVGTLRMSFLAARPDLRDAYGIQLILLYELTKLIEMAARAGTASALAKSVNGRNRSGGR